MLPKEMILDDLQYSSFSNIQTEMYTLFYNMIGVYYILYPTNAFIPFLPWSLGEK